MSKAQKWINSFTWTLSMSSGPTPSPGKRVTWYLPSELLSAPQLELVCNWLRANKPGKRRESRLTAILYFLPFVDKENISCLFTPGPKPIIVKSSRDLWIPALLPIYSRVNKIGCCSLGRWHVVLAAKLFSINIWLPHISFKIQFFYSNHTTQIKEHQLKAKRFIVTKKFSLIN